MLQEQSDLIPIAKVDDQIITDVDLIERVKQIERVTPQVLSTHNQKKELLQQMINLELIYQEALRRKFDERYAFKAKLAEAFVNYLGEEELDGISEQSLLNYYEKNRREFDQIAARHILIRTDGGVDPEEAYRQIKEIEKEVKANPHLFGEIAKTKSQDASAQKGGELGYFPFQRMVPQFASAAWKLKEINEISPIVRTKYGYHLIQLTGDKRKFEVHRDQIEKRLSYLRQSQALEKLITKLRSEVEIEVYQTNLKSLSPLPEVIKKPADEVLPEDLAPPGSEESKKKEEGSN